MNRLVILTGVSGSGVSSAKSIFEEEGYYIVENPPHEIIPQLLKSFENRSNNIHKFCLILHISEVKKSLKEIKQNKNFKTKIVLLMANKQELIKRFALTRHTHIRTINENLPLEKAIDKDMSEANQLSPDVDLSIETKPAPCFLTAEGNPFLSYTISAVDITN